MPHDTNEQSNGKWWIMAGVGLTVTATVGVWIAASSAQGDDGKLAAAGIDATEKAAIERIVRDYILENPEIIPEAVAVLQSRQRAEIIEPMRAAIEEPFAGKAFAGNPDGDVTVVEYSDYSCPFCKQTAADIEQLIAGDKGVKVVFRELPVLGEASREAALMSLAAAEQDKYFAFHRAMFAAGRPTPANIEKAARTAGLDLSAARAFARTDRARAEVERNVEVARELQLTGTPAFVVGDETQVGAVGLEGLQDLVAQARGSE